MPSIADIKEQVAKQEQAVAITIYDLAGEPYPARDGTPATISVIGAESKRMRKFEESQRARIRQGVYSGDTAAEEERRRLDRVVEAIESWSGWYAGDADLECTPENVRALLGAPECEHILRQVERGIAVHGVFSKASSVA